MIEVQRAVVADRELTRLAQARSDICNIARVPSAAERHARIGASIIAHC